MAFRIASIPYASNSPSSSSSLIEQVPETSVSADPAPQSLNAAIQQYLNKQSRHMPRKPCSKCNKPAKNYSLQHSFEIPCEPSPYIIIEGKYKDVVDSGAHPCVPTACWSKKVYYLSNLIGYFHFS